MAFKIVLHTEDDEYYSEETYDTYEEAEDEVERELSEDSYFDDDPVIGAEIKKI